ncbi:MAG: hypothetical protein QJR09_00360 [Micrococcus sp.]|nr:hypothetical protein [Micrococcus sp.]
MSVRTRTASTGAARTTGHRHCTRAGAGVAGLALALMLTACADRGAEPAPEPSQTITATASPSGTPRGTGGATATVPTTTSATASSATTAPVSSPAATEAAGTGDLPSPDLETAEYDGEPRRLEDVYHLECIHALDGEDVPENTDAEVAEGTKPVWSVMHTQALTDGWKNCPTRMYGTIAIPAAFSVETTPGGGTIDRLRIFDAQGRQVGGVGVDVTGAAPEGAEVIEVVEVTEDDFSPSYGGEVPYLRSLVVKTGSGYQLMVDLVSAPEGTDPETLEVWDLAAYGGASRELVYASIPLDSPEDADEAAASELHAVLRAMVGSYTLPVQ